MRGSGFRGQVRLQFGLAVRDNAPIMPTRDETKEQVLKRIVDCGVVAVIRAGSTDQLLEVGRALLAGGVIGVEVTMTTPGALKGIRMLCEELAPDGAVIGVGTVMDADSCRKAIDAGARYVVSPHFDPAIVAATRERGRISIPGAMTPTEILRAASGGAVAGVRSEGDSGASGTGEGVSGV